MDDRRAPRLSSRPIGPLLLICLLGPGCREAARGLGTTGDPRSRAGTLIESLAARFGPTERDPAFEALRPKLARHGLVPSRVFEDTALWTLREGEARGVGFVGRGSPFRYHVGVSGSPREPASPGDYRGEWRLERLRHGEFEWAAKEELDVGPVTPADLAAGLTALFRGAAEAPRGDAAGLVRRALPRTTARLGRVLTLEALRLGGTAGQDRPVRLEAVLEPRGLEAEAPRYARYLEKVVLPLGVEVSAFDASGTRWWRLSMEDGRLVLELRVSGGGLAPSDGSRRVLPSVLRLRAAGTTRAAGFRVGFHDLDAEVTLVRLPTEKGFVARFRDAPSWDLPFLVPLLLRSPLRRPFQGDGSMLAFGVRARPGETTLLTRHYRAAVQENWVLRWLGGLTARNVDAFRRAEDEADAFTCEVLLALRDDVLALLAPPS
jgi:hypothetical protein